MSLGLGAIYGRGFAATELTTILNRCHRFRGFVYEHARFSADKKSIEVVVRPRKGSAAAFSRCHLPAPSVGILRLPSVPDAARRLPQLWRGGRRRSSLG